MTWHSRQPARTCALRLVTLIGIERYAAAHLMVDVLDAGLAGAHVTALEAQVPHPRQRQLPQVA